MEILNKKTVVVLTIEELKSVLSENNEYNYVYLGNDITLTSGFTINKNKKKITIDGTYLGNRYTYTGMNSISQDDVIAASPTNKKIIIKNMNIIHINPNSVIYVRGDKEYSEVIVEYNNIKFNGVQLGYNIFGKIKIIDCNITIEDTEGTAAQEVCESNDIEIGGNTTIYSSSASYVLFYYKNTMPSPSIKFLPYSRVNLTTVDREFMNGINNLNFSILHDAEVNLIAGNGFSAFTIHGASDVLIDERATFNFIENNHQRIPMWNIFGNLTMNEGSNLFVINSYNNTPSDNYNIYFKGNSQKITLNNPNNIIIYTKNSNILYTNNPVEFSFNFDRLNMWTNSTELNNAGGINNMPDYSWYKSEGLIQINGTFSTNETIISSHNIESEQLAKLPDLSNFSFQNKKQFSTGSSKINIHPIDTTQNIISGHTLPFAKVLIEFDTINNIVEADENGLFEFNSPSEINEDMNIQITSCVDGSFVYKKRIITLPYNGELTLMEAPNNITFSFEPISLEPIILPKKNESVLKVIDSRKTSSNWKLYVHIIGPLTSSNNFILKNALIFKDFNNIITILNEVPSLIFTGTDSGGEVEISNITWSTDKGILIRLIDSSLKANEEYNTKIIWNIEE